MKTSIRCSLLFMCLFVTKLTQGCYPCRCSNLDWIGGVNLYTANCNYNSLKSPLNKIPASLESYIEAIVFTDQFLLNLDGNELRLYKDVRCLSFLNNKMQHVENNTFKYMYALQYLNLGDNKIAELSAELFQNTPRLETVRLHKNKLKFLPNNLFENLFFLKEIELQNNEIEIIENSCFSNLFALETLDLSSNFLKTLYLNFHNLQSLKYVNLEMNPWECDDSLCYLIKTVTEQKLFGNREIPKCRNKNKKPWNMLTHEDFSPSIISNVTSVMHGESFIVQCRYCFVSHVIWTVNDLQFTNEYYEIDDTSAISTLRIKNVSYDQKGNYTCQIKNCSKCDVAHININISEAITTTPEYEYLDYETSPENLSNENYSSNASSFASCYILLVFVAVFLHLLR